MYKLKITVENPSKASKTGSNNTLKDIQTASPLFEVIKARLQIESISKDGIVTIMVKAVRGGPEVCKVMQTEDIEMWTEIKDAKQVVKANVSSKDPEKSLVKFSLQFEDPGKISTRQVWDRLFIKVVKNVQSRNSEYLVYLPFGSNASDFIPPQISTGKIIEI